MWHSMTVDFLSVYQGTSITKNIFNKNVNFDISVYFMFVYQGTYLTQIKFVNKILNSDN